MAHHLRSSSLDTKSVDVGSMFLIDLSVEESCDPDNSEQATEEEELNEFVEDDDDFRELRQQQLQLQQQQQLQLQLQHKQATINKTASKTIATSMNSKNQNQQQQIIEDDETGSILSSFDTTTDIQMPPSNDAVSYSDHEFLEQEYNDNHHNHYSTDESDDEPLSAEDNPMKLFESIQALARSLHEDAELFGSLPPKRTLESPIRSLLLT